MLNAEYRESYQSYRIYIVLSSFQSLPIGEKKSIEKGKSSATFHYFPNLCNSYLNDHHQLLYLWAGPCHSLKHLRLPKSVVRHVCEWAEMMTMNGWWVEWRRREWKITHKSTECQFLARRPENNCLQWVWMTGVKESNLLFSEAVEPLIRRVI